MTRERVRVLCVIGSLMVGGAETFLARVAPEVQKHGIEIEICALDPTGPRLAELESAGIRVHGTPYPERTTHSNTLTLLRTVAHIRRLVRAGRFDVVHTHLFWADVLGVPGAKLAGCPRIIVSRVALHAWAHSKSRLFHALEQASNAMADEAIVNSQAVLRDVVAHERQFPRVRTVIHYGIDVDSYPASTLRHEGPLRLITVGALAPRKGQEYAIEAIRQLSSAGVDVELTLLGSGPDEAKLRRIATTGVLGRVKFAGQHEDARPFLSSADVLVMPSRQEGFSLAILEGMAAALPVVATDVGGNAEAIVDGEGGFIVEPANPEALATAIKALVDDPSLRASMGRFNRMRAQEKFSLEASARDLASWYRSPDGHGV